VTTGDDDFNIGGADFTTNGESLISKVGQGLNMKLDNEASLKALTTSK